MGFYFKDLAEETILDKSPLYIYNLDFNAPFWKCGSRVIPEWLAEKGIACCFDLSEDRMKACISADKEISTHIIELISKRSYVNSLDFLGKFI